MYKCPSDPKVMDRVLCDIISALATFHAKGLLYHDMKFDNIVCDGTKANGLWTEVSGFTRG